MRRLAVIFMTFFGTAVLIRCAWIAFQCGLLDVIFRANFVFWVLLSMLVQVVACYWYWPTFVASICVLLLQLSSYSGKRGAAKITTFAAAGLLGAMIGYRCEILLDPKVTAGWFGAVVSALGCMFVMVACQRYRWRVYHLKLQH